MKLTTHRQLMATRHKIANWNALIAGFKAALAREPTNKEYEFADFNYGKTPQDCFSRGLELGVAIARKEAGI